jgi:hypothetical protein
MTKKVLQSNPWVPNDDVKMRDHSTIRTPFAPARKRLQHDA